MKINSKSIINLEVGATVPALGFPKFKTMTEEQLKRGKSLSEEICRLKENKQTWERSTRFREQLVLNYPLNNGAGSSYVNNEYVDFDHLKLVTVARLNKMIEEAQKEFDSL